MSAAGQGQMSCDVKSLQPPQMSLNGQVLGIAHLQSTSGGQADGEVCAGIPDLDDS